MSDEDRVWACDVLVPHIKAKDNRGLVSLVCSGCYADLKRSPYDHNSDDPAVYEIRHTLTDCLIELRRQINRKQERN